MEHNIKDLDKGEKLITVTVPAAELEPYLEKASQSLSEQKDIDGFRPGKAPREVVEKKFGAMAVLEKALDDIVNSTYYQILEQEKILTVGKPQVEFEKIVPGNDLEYSAKIALLPEVKIGDIDKVKVSRPNVQVTDKDIEAVFNDLQKMRAKEILVKRAAKMGDKVEIDFTVKLNGVVIEGGVGEKYPLILGEGRFIPGFEEKVVGMKVEEQRQFKLKFPDEYKADLKGKEADFEVKMLAVYERQLPDLNDELAKQAGQYKNLAELRERVKANLKADKETKADQEWEVKILERLVDISEFSDIPELLVKNEIHRMKHELEESLSSQGLKLDQYLQQIGKSQSDLESDWQAPAIKRVKTALVARAIAEKENIQASETEITEEKEKMLADYSDRPEVEENIKSPEFHDYLFHTLTNRKVVEYLKDKIDNKNELKN